MCVGVGWESMRTDLAVLPAQATPPWALGLKSSLIPLGLALTTQPHSQFPTSNAQRPTPNSHSQLPTANPPPQEVLQALHTHLGSGVGEEVDTALAALQQLAEGGCAFACVCFGTGVGPLTSDALHATQQAWQADRSSGVAHIGGSWAGGAGPDSLSAVGALAGLRGPGVWAAVLVAPSAAP